MSVIEKLNDRIKTKITPETSARIDAIRERESNVESQSTLPQRPTLGVQHNTNDEPAPGMRF